MIKFNGTYTPEWQEELNDTKLGQLCGNRDVLEYKGVIKVGYKGHIEIIINFKHPTKGYCFISDRLYVDFVKEQLKMPKSHILTESGALKILEVLKTLDRAWEAAYG